MDKDTIQKYIYIIVCTVSMLLAFIRDTATAQDTASQDNTVNVPVVLSLTAPADQSINHDGTNTDQVLDTDTEWVARSNNRAGATLNIEGPDFENGADASITRSTKLDLTKSSGDNWSVTAASDQSGGGMATVTAESDGPGTGRFDVVVTFVESTTTDIAPSGTYTTTVTGTLAAK